MGWLVTNLESRNVSIYNFLVQITDKLLPGNRHLVLFNESRSSLRLLVSFLVHKADKRFDCNLRHINGLNDFENKEKLVLYYVSIYYAFTYLFSHCLEVEDAGVARADD